jgi:hypothetical protein
VSERPPDRSGPEAPGAAPERWALVAAAGILATGGFFNPASEPVPTDLVPAAAAAGLGLLVIARGSGRLLPAPSWALLALLVLSLRDGLTDIRETASLATAAIAAAAAYRVRADDAARRVVLAASLLLLAIGIYHRFAVFPELIPSLRGEARDRLLSGRIFSTFLLPGQYSSYLATILPIAIAAGLVDRYRVAARIALVGILVGLFMAGSLTGLIAGAIGAIALLGVSRRMPPIILAGILAAGIIVATRPELRRGHNPVTMRMQTAAATIDGWTDAPWLGHGPGSFEALYMPLYWREGADETRHPHCWPLKIAFEHGLLGLLFWLGMVASLFAPVRDRSFRAAAAAFFAASLMDLGDHSVTLRALGLLFLGASLRNPAADAPDQDDGSDSRR